MIASVFKRTLISWFAAFAILFLAAIIWGRPLIAIAYLTVGHRVAISLKQQWLAHGPYAAAVAADLSSSLETKDGTVAKRSTLHTISFTMTTLDSRFE